MSPVKVCLSGYKRTRSELLLKMIILSVLVTTSQAQIVSHELRRLAVATNQFGIDTLKALDKIEPPDKVLVFCPLCLSSTLVMIMMGSSKYQVVSSLRHALYVWSMRPQDINQGFKDIFQHIGLNQNQLSTGRQSSFLPMEFKRSDAERTSLNDELRLHAIHDHRFSLEDSHAQTRMEALSLPRLMRLKDMLESSVQKGIPWWHTMSKRHDVKLSNLTRPAEKSEKLLSAVEPSQMSAMCNIYIQRGLTLNYNYNILLRKYYDTVIHPVDFMKSTEETRQHINALVAANTENKIKDLVKRSLLEQRGPPKIMMISTFHFRGTLDIEMKSKNTHPNRTHSRRRHSRQANQSKASPPQYLETEPTLLKYGHFTNLDCSVIEIPFNNRLISLVVVVPDRHNSTELVLTRLSARILSDMVNSLVVKKLSLEIPVIKFDRGPVNTRGLFKELGIDDIFFDNQTFSTESGLNRWMRASDILHETSIDIGTRNPNWGQTEDRLKVGAHERLLTEANHIRLDKPFFYFVMDTINSLILTTGRIRQ